MEESSLVVFTEVHRFTLSRRHLYLCEGVRTKATLQPRTSWRIKTQATKTEKDPMTSSDTLDVRSRTTIVNLSLK